MKKLTKLEGKRLEEFKSRLGSLEFDMYEFASDLEDNGKRFVAERINSGAFELDKAQRIIKYLLKIGVLK